MSRVTQYFLENFFHVFSPKSITVRKLDIDPLHESRDRLSWDWSNCLHVTENKALIGGYLQKKFWWQEMFLLSPVLSSSSPHFSFSQIIIKILSSPRPSYKAPHTQSGWEGDVFFPFGRSGSVRFLSINPKKILHKRIFSRGKYFGGGGEKYSWYHWAARQLISTHSTPLCRQNSIYLILKRFEHSSKSFLTRLHNAPHSEEGIRNRKRASLGRSLFKVAWTLRAF